MEAMTYRHVYIFTLFASGLCLRAAESSITRQLYGKVYRNSRMLGGHTALKTPSLLECVAACKSRGFRFSPGVNFHLESHRCRILWENSTYDLITEDKPGWTCVMLEEVPGLAESQVYGTVPPSMEVPTPAIATHGCPPDFVAIGDGCYIVQTHAVYATYDEISAHCNQRGANLASLETEMEFYLIRDYIIYVFYKVCTACDRGWLLGGRRQHGEYRWQTGGLIPTSSQHWGLYQPAEDCMALDPYFGFKYVSIFCNQGYYHQFVCEL